MEPRRPLLHRIGEAGARFGTRPPRSKRVRLAIQLGIALLIFGFLVLTVVSQWSEIQDKGVHFHVLWLIPAFVVLPVFYVFSALGWDLILRCLGYRVGAGQAQVAWGQPMLARYVPGSVLYVLGRVLLSERLGVPRRIDGGQHRLRTGDLRHLGGHLRRLLLHHPPRPRGPAAALRVPAPDPGGDRAPAPAGLRAARRPAAARLRPRAAARGDLDAGNASALLGFYLLNWVVIAIGTYCVARSVSDVSLDEMLTVGSAQALGYVAALATLVAPAGLGVRDAVFAWAVKGAVPGGASRVGSLIAIAVRGVLTVVEVIYVAAVTALGRRQGWSIHTGVFHASARRKRPNEAGDG